MVLLKDPSAVFADSRAILFDSLAFAIFARDASRFLSDLEEPPLLLNSL
jgi:hypothetical protein